MLRKMSGLAKLKETDVLSSSKAAASLRFTGLKVGLTLWCHSTACKAPPMILTSRTKKKVCVNADWIQRVETEVLWESASSWQTVPIWLEERIWGIYISKDLAEIKKLRSVILSINRILFRPPPPTPLIEVILLTSRLHDAMLQGDFQLLRCSSLAPILWIHSFAIEARKNWVLMSSEQVSCTPSPPVFVRNARLLNRLCLVSLTVATL